MRIFFTFLVASALAYSAVHYSESCKTSQTSPFSDTAHARTAVKPLPTTLLPSREVQASFPKSAHDTVSSQILSTESAAKFCDQLDLITHPEHADDMVRFASAQYGTPSGLLNGVWHTESYHGINGQTGTCNVMSQFTIRNCWKPGTTTRRPKGCTSPYIFAGENASESRWKTPPRKVGIGTMQKQSILRIAKALGLNPWSIRGSCGNRSLTGLNNPNKKSSHGGCFGNMQITPSEWEADVKAMGYGLSELTPFNLCDSMLVSSYRLKKHHDQRYKRYMKNKYWHSHKEKANQLSWIWSGRRYLGDPEKSTANDYERHNKWGRGNSRRRDIFTLTKENGGRFPCGWNCWDTMSTKQNADGTIGDFSPLTNWIKKRGKKERARRNLSL